LPALEDVVARLQPLLHRVHDIRVRYEVGRLVATLKKHPDRYGEGAVTVVARKLGEDVPTLYRYAGVAESWSLPEVESMLARRGVDGRSPSWSHLVTLTPVKAQDVRRELFEQVVRDRLSVAELSRAVARAARKQSPRG
jgi:hypothetical protein